VESYEGWTEENSKWVVPRTHNLTEPHNPRSQSQVLDAPKAVGSEGNQPYSE
jgi:hypothetical protein